jgi:serine/threonine protein kinase/formylglycine-generating enzyme required for sulfatase activity
MREVWPSSEGRVSGENATKPALSVEPHARSREDAAEDEQDVGVFQRGSTLGRYLVLELLGTGGAGVVYAAYDPELDRKVALKVLRPQEATGDAERRQARLLREARAIAKVSHPNVVAIFDVGVNDGQVFLAMEYLAGGTLRQWMGARRRPWREVVAMFIEIGRGLAGAHAEGLIHRDFKPDNVLLDKAEKPKVLDFGLVRLTTDLESSGSSPSLPSLPAVAGTARDAQKALTRTGSLVGTPAYMAPEQFLGLPIDARTDQFAFCVALFEALYGERPFEGENVLNLAVSVTEGRVRPDAKRTDVPGWVRSAVFRGLQAKPDQRFSSLERLLAVLENDPVVRRRRRAFAIAATSLVVAGSLAVRHTLASKRQELDRQVAEHVGAASAALREASSKRLDATDLRTRALGAFDGYDEAKGEELWSQSLSLADEARAAFRRGIQRLEAASLLVPSPGLRVQTADAIAKYLDVGDLPANELATGLRQLAAFDNDGSRLRRLNAPAHLKLGTGWARLAASLELYDPTTFRRVGSSKPMGETPLSLELAPGSYRLTFAPGAATAGFSYPLTLSAGENFETTLEVPPRSKVPPGFVYVPEGRFLFGSSDEEIRAVFLETTPIHETRTAAFLISRFETTIGEWISYLDSLPLAERERRRPQGRKDGLGGFIDLHRAPDGKWVLQFRATNVTYSVREGEPFHYRDRLARANQDWLRFPVTGISPKDALAYAEWLDRSGRVPGARLCNEREWERAARGADGREFPHGNRLLPADANFDLTYGRKDGAYGPDEVGSHPESTSPFGIDDLVGNVWDITTSVLDKDQYVARGSSFYECRRSQLSTNRDPLSGVTRDHTIGVRICADVRF